MWLTRALLESVAWLESHLFITPSAWLASLLSGSPLLQDGSGHWILLTSEDQAQRITAECSGIGYFSLLVGLCLWRCGGAARGRAAAWWPWLCLYPLALLTNACRISLSAPAGLISEYTLGPRFHDIVHMAFGALFFVTVLFTFNRLLVHAYRYRSQTP